MSLVCSCKNCLKKVAIGCMVVIGGLGVDELTTIDKSKLGAYSTAVL